MSDKNGQPKYLMPHVEREDIVFSGPTGLPCGTFEVSVTLPGCVEKRMKIDLTSITIKLGTEALTFKDWKRSIPQLINLLNAAEQWIVSKKGETCEQEKAVPNDV